MMANNTIENKNWWENLYSELLADILLEEQPEELLNESVDFLFKIFNLKAGDSLFDQCCGVGNLAIKLAQKGIDIYGVDLGENYIARALKKADNLNLKLNLVSGDAFTYKTDKPCNYAINWWTGFGYAESDEQNMEMIKMAYDSLEIGGKYLIDFMNVAQVMKDFKPQVINEKETNEGKVTLIRNSRMELTDGHMYKEWIFIMPDEQKIINHSKVKLYMPHQLAEFFIKCGFKNIKFYGNTKAEPLELNSPRCIITGEK